MWLSTASASVHSCKQQSPLNGAISKHSYVTDTTFSDSALYETLNSTNPLDTSKYGMVICPAFKCKKNNNNLLWKIVIHLLKVATYLVFIFQNVKTSTHVWHHTQRARYNWSWSCTGLTEQQYQVLYNTITSYIWNYSQTRLSYKSVDTCGRQQFITAGVTYSERNTSISPEILRAELVALDTRCQCDVTLVSVRIHSHCAVLVVVVHILRHAWLERRSPRFTCCVNLSCLEVACFLAQMIIPNRWKVLSLRTEGRQHIIIYHTEEHCKTFHKKT